MGSETASSIMLDDLESSHAARPFQISMRASQAGVKRFHLHERPSHQVVVVCEPQLEHSRCPSQGSRAAASPCAMRSSAALLSCMHMSRLSKLSAACTSEAFDAACLIRLMAQLGIPCVMCSSASFCSALHVHGFQSCVHVQLGLESCVHVQLEHSRWPRQGCRAAASHCNAQQRRLAQLHICMRSVITQDTHHLM